MAKAQGTPTNSRPAARPTAPVIRSTGSPGGPGLSAARMLLFGTCLAVSVAVHVLLIALMFLVNVERSSADTPNATTETSVIETKVEDTNTTPPNLENDEMGLDPDLPTQYDVNRKEEVSVPGMVNVDAAVGLPGAAEAPATTLPPPPGFGDNRSSGGGVDSPIAGSASMVGFAGGMGGPRMIAGGFGGRSGSTRERMVQEGGGNSLSEAAVAAGLKWFAAHQAPDGHWSLDHFNQHGRCNCTGYGMSNDIAGTAFGLLPFLGAGQTHKGTGAKGSAYYMNVQRALTYLMAKQNREGDFGGGMYAHGLATIAMCEAYGLTSDPVLKNSAQRGINFICAAQGAKGGWDYSPRGGNDTSVGGWQLMALKSGQMSGLDVPSRTLSGAGKWLDGCSNARGSGYGYRGPADGASAMTAVGLLCRQYLGWGPRNPGLREGVNELKKAPPLTIATNCYHFYYATQVMHHMGGDDWDFWNPKMRDLLISKQEKGDTKHPHHKGSWSPAGDAHGGAGGRMMVSSLSLLTLEVYYRHLPLYRRDMGTGK